MPETTARIEHRHLVLVVAAVAAVCGENARILGIVPAVATAGNAWTHAGRLSIQGSHRTGRPAFALRTLAKPYPGAPTK